MFIQRIALKWMFFFTDSSIFFILESVCNCISFVIFWINAEAGENIWSQMYAIIFSSACKVICSVQCDIRGAQLFFTSQNNVIPVWLVVSWLHLYIFIYHCMFLFIRLQVLVAWGLTHWWLDSKKTGEIPDPRI